MFRALDSLNKESPNEKMREYLSNANFYIFTDRKSAGPASWAEFANMWIISNLLDDISADDAYSFVKNNLQRNTSFAGVFDVISISECRDVCNIVTGEETTG